MSDIASYDLEDAGQEWWIIRKQRDPIGGNPWVRFARFRSRAHAEQVLALLLSTIELIELAVAEHE
jgi:hypothetical protein